MATPKVYVICDSNCKYEGMTREQILTAITQAVNNGTIGNIDTGFISTVKTITGTPLRFFVGTQYEYDALTDTQKENLFAIISNDSTKEGILASIAALEEDTEAFKEHLDVVNREIGRHGTRLANLENKETKMMDANVTVADDDQWHEIIPYKKDRYLLNRRYRIGIEHIGILHYVDVKFTAYGKNSPILGLSGIALYASVENINTVYDNGDKLKMSLSATDTMASADRKVIIRDIWEITQ